MKSFIAIDGGGSTTRCAIADETSIVCTLDAATAKPLVVGVQQSARILFDTILQICAVSDIPFARLRGVAIGMSGVWEATEVKELTDQLYAIANAQMYALPRLVITSDVDIAHRGAFADKPGILVIAGTGSIAVCRDPEGQLHRVGGYGPMIGDEGSGSWIGQRALSHVLRCCDGRSRPGHLFSYVAEYLHLNLPDQARDLAMLMHHQHLQSADLAPLVFRAAVERDRDAIEILHEASIALVELADALARNVGLRNAPVCFRGGIAEQASMQRRLLRRMDEVIGLRWVDCTGTALDGAMEMARALDVKKVKAA